MSKDMGTTQDKIASLKGKFLTIDQVVQLLKVLVDAINNNSNIKR